MTILLSEQVPPSEPLPGDVPSAAHGRAGVGLPPQSAAPRVSQVGRGAYITGSIVWLAIGILHTVTHLDELATPELEARFAELGDIQVSGRVVESWDLWQGTSLLMGVFAMGLGLANLGALRASADRRPPIVNCLSTIAVLAMVGWVGWAYLGPLQLFGAPFGIVLFTIALVAGRWDRSSSVSH